MKMFLVKYTYGGKKYSVRVRAYNPIDCMSLVKGCIYSIREVIV